MLVSDVTDLFKCDINQGLIKKVIKYNYAVIKENCVLEIAGN